LALNQDNVFYHAYI